MQIKGGKVCIVGYNLRNPLREFLGIEVGKDKEEFFSSLHFRGTVTVFDLNKVDQVAVGREGEISIANRGKEILLRRREGTKYFCDLLLRIRIKVEVKENDFSIKGEAPLEPGEIGYIGEINLESGEIELIANHPSYYENEEEIEKAVEKWIREKYCFL